jgi:hypothetical protein
LIKSVIRITGCIVALIHNSFWLLVTAFLAAEVLGVFEEVFDER